MDLDTEVAVSDIKLFVDLAIWPKFKDRHLKSYPNKERSTINSGSLKV